ncbi:MAG: LLM class flavin-dependent oxidoreductase [Albidovulum sp.]
MMLGVGRGAFKVEMERLGVPMEETRERFDESLDVLQALLNEEEVSWDGKYYKFDPITIMPRPVRPGGPPMMMAVMNPEGIYHCTKRGFHIQTTPLAGNRQLLHDQVGAFTRAKEKMGEAGQDLTLSLSRVSFVTQNEADRQAKLSAAEYYYSKFDNVYTGPGLIDNGMVRPLPRSQTREELDANLLICSPQAMIDQLGPYSDLGVNRVILSMNFGASQTETLESIQCFAEEVMPHFSVAKTSVAAE